MDVLSDEQYEILAFIAICNRRSYLPTEAEVGLWRSSPHPAPARYRRVSTPPPPGVAAALGQFANVDIAATLMPAFAQLSSALAGTAATWGPTLEWATGGRQELVSPAETTIAHLVRLTWLERVSKPHAEAAGLRLTDLGHALYTDVEMSDASEEDISVVVLGKDDPLAYPILIGRLAQVGPGLLIDPYLKLEGLHQLVISTQLTRVLVSEKGRQQAAQVGAMRTYLNSSSLPRDLEVRVSKDLHDRVVVADDGDVHTLGTSLNSVGRKTTVFSPMPDAAAEVLIEEYAELWQSADLVGPTPPEVESNTD